MLSILAFVRFYPPHSNCGSDRMLHTILKFFQERGHKVIVMLGDEAKGVPYVYDGIRVIGKTEWLMPYVADADMVFTHLDFTADCCNIVKAKPIVWFYHNHSLYGTVGRNKDRVTVVYNSEHAARENAYPFNRSLVLQPPIDMDWVKVPRETSDRFITLINLTDRKGGDLFYRIAEALPEYQFLGVKGSYGIQVMRDIPLSNVTIMENTADIRKVYRQTEILLMPSVYESWGRTATEAAINGIPVISTDTPGLRENMGDAGLYCDLRRLKEWTDMIKKLKGKKEYDRQSQKVRDQAEKHRPDKKLEVFEEEMYKIAKKPKPVKKQEYDKC